MVVVVVFIPDGPRRPVEELWVVMATVGMGDLGTRRLMRDAHAPTGPSYEGRPIQIDLENWV